MAPLMRTNFGMDVVLLHPRRIGPRMAISTQESAQLLQASIGERCRFSEEFSRRTTKVLKKSLRVQHHRTRSGAERGNAKNPGAPATDKQVATEFSKGEQSDLCVCKGSGEV